MTWQGDCSSDVCSTDLVQAGQVFLANLAGGFSLPALAAQLSAALQARFGASFPELVAAFNNSFAGLVQVSQNLAANLAGSFGGGLSGFVQAGQVFLANLAGGLKLAGQGKQVNAGGRRIIRKKIPEVVAAFN